MVNSRQKGKRGEREAVAFLKSLGFADARRGQQFRGGPDSPDVVVPSLPKAHFEVKFGRPRETFDLGTKVLCEAVGQAAGERGNHQHWFLLWKPRGCQQWRMTCDIDGYTATLDFDALIKRRLVEQGA